MQFLKDTKIDFINKRKGAYLLSGILVAASILSLVIKGGPNLGIDFSGGTLVQLKFSKQLSTQEARSILNAQGLSGAELQRFPEDNVIIVRMKKTAGSAEEVYEKIKKTFSDARPDNTFVVERSEMVGPVISRDLVKKALMAIILSSLAILVYVAWRFKGGIWGIGGIIALIHDVLITVGIFSILNKEVTLPVVAALLTLAGYSINDTIVIYDRIRENLKLRRGGSLLEVVNFSLNSVLSRTIITSLTTLFVLVALFFKGGSVIHDFSFALLIGVIIGTYSSIFIASPIVYEHIGKNPRVRR
ncbi:MAG: protein translocase subunit SecF [bacterium]